MLPLDDRTIELFGGAAAAGHRARPARLRVLPADRRTSPPTPAPPLGGRDWTITAEVDVPDGGVEGVLYARGGHNVGHTFFVQDGALHFDYNALGTHHRATAPLPLVAGRHELDGPLRPRRARAARSRSPSTATTSPSIEIPKLVRMLGSTGLDIGRDALSPVVDDYEPPFPFTGTIDRITFPIRSRADAADVAATARAELAKE